MNDINAYSRRVFIRQGALLASFAATLPHFIQQSAFGMLAPDGSVLGSRQVAQATPDKLRAVVSGTNTTSS